MGGQYRGSHVEFGANQCQYWHCPFMTRTDKHIGILVRDDTAKEKLRNEVGDIGIIM
jgi:hypothetical protein